MTRGEQIRRERVSYLQLCRAQVNWYRQHGKHPKYRIRRDSSGVEYVIGDQSWNAHCAPGNSEYVDYLLPKPPKENLIR